MTIEHRYIEIISGKSRTPLAMAARGALCLAELPYRALMQMRNSAYDSGVRASYDLGRPTISVGNITAGGTGKTPVVQWLVQMLGEDGRNPAVLLRGYRKQSATVSDEQVMLQSQLPDASVEANPNRINGAADVLGRDPGVDCFVLDDGFQHRRARRRFDLVLIHAAEPFGFGHVHPRGLLREPLEGLSRASAILITHASEVPPERLLVTQNELRRYSDVPIFHCDHVNVQIISDQDEARELSDLAMIPFMLFTGIGQPQSLASSLHRFAAYKGDRFYEDHHHYSKEDVSSLNTAALACGAKALVSTEKDWVKLKPLWQGAADTLPLYRLRLQIRFWENEEQLLKDMIIKAMFAQGRA